MKVYVKPNTNKLKLVIALIWLIVAMVLNTSYDTNNLSILFLGIGILISVYQLKKETCNKK